MRGRKVELGSTELSGVVLPYPHCSGFVLLPKWATQEQWNLECKPRLQGWGYWWRMIQRAAVNEECHLRSWSGVSQSPLAVMRACSTGFSVWSVGMHTGSAMYVLVYAHTLVCLVSLVCIPASSLHDSHAWFPSQKMIAADSAPN